jgi:hypothetical protein
MTPEPEPAVSFLVGRDDHDHWIAVETHGLCGGIFADEAAALRFARAESGRRPGAVRSISHIAGDFLHAAGAALQAPVKPV